MVLTLLKAQGLRSWLLKCWRWRRRIKALSHSRGLGHWWDRVLLRHIRIAISRPVSIWVWRSCAIPHSVLGSSSWVLLIFAFPLSMGGIVISGHVEGAGRQDGSK